MNLSWNNFNLQCPPYSTWCTNQNAFNIKTFLATIDKTIGEFESMNDFDIEAAFLSRLIYRMKLKFRSDKGLKSMEKVKRALINYLNMSLVQDYQNLRSCVRVENKMVTLPSRQLLEYTLVRTQGFAKILERLEQVARHSAHFIRMRIKLGHAWSISLVAYAAVSRIWFLTRDLIRRCCSWYKKLYKYLDTLQYVGLPWLSKDQLLPHHLEQWLSVEWMHSEEIRDNKWNNTIFKLLEEHPVDCDNVASPIAEFCETTDNSINTSQNDISIHDASDDAPTSSADIDDIGVTISRKDFSKKCETRDIETSLAKKRKYFHICEDERPIKSKKGKKQETKDLIKVKSSKSKSRKKHKRAFSSNVNFCEKGVTRNVRTTSETKKRKK